MTLILVEAHRGDAQETRVAFSSCLAGRLVFSRCPRADCYRSGAVGVALWANGHAVRGLLVQPLLPIRIVCGIPAVPDPRASPRAVGRAAPTPTVAGVPIDSICRRDRTCERCRREARVQGKRRIPSWIS